MTSLADRRAAALNTLARRTPPAQQRYPGETQPSGDLMPSRLGRAGRALRTTWTYWPDKGRRHHQIAYAALHPHLTAYGLWLWATHSTRTRSSR